MNRIARYDSYYWNPFLFHFLFFGKMVDSFAAKILIYIQLYVRQCRKKWGDVQDLGLLLNQIGMKQRLDYEIKKIGKK